MIYLPEADRIRAHHTAAFRWWQFPRYVHDRDAVVTIESPVWWRQAWWRWLAGPAFRFLIALGVWETARGGYYVGGRWTWANRYVRRVPEFPRDGREFWNYVRHGSLPADLRYYAESPPQ